MKHIDPSFYPAPHSALHDFDQDDRTIVLVTVSRFQGEDAIARIRSALPGSDVINLSRLYVDRDLGEHGPGVKSTLAPLTLRQQEILDFLLTGLSNKEIARKLGLSHFTVRNHVSNILRILNFPCRREMRRSLGGGRSASTYPTSLVA